MERKLVYGGEIYDNFSITEHGEVKNLKTNHIYKNSISNSGYCVVYLPMGKRGKVKCIRVHKAVAETYIPNPNNFPIVHHKDENKSNPDWTNLEWTTSKKNTEYHLNELKNNTEYFNNRKLSKEDIAKIRLYTTQMSRREIAKIFNVSKTTIINLLNGKLYKDVS